MGGRTDLGSGMGILYRCVGGIGTSIGIGGIVNPSPLLLFCEDGGGVQGDISQNIPQQYHSLGGIYGVPGSII